MEYNFSKERFYKIKKHWDNQNTYSMRDFFVKDIEISKITSLIDSLKQKFDYILEIGCGDGEGTSKYSNFSKNFIAIDYSMTMLKKAKANVSNKNVFFIQADVRYLPFKKDFQVDLIISERCLINLPSKEEQYTTIDKLLNLNKTYFILAEGSKQGLDNINKLRKLFQLDDIKMPWHNIFFDEDELLDFLKNKVNIIKKGSFWFYYLSSRVLHPAYVQPDNPTYESKFNEYPYKIYKELEASFFEQIEEPYSIGQIFYMLIEKK